MSCTLFLLSLQHIIHYNNSIMGKVKFKRGTPTDLNSIDRDPDTLYAVNDSGDFSEESMGETCTLYVGDKRVTPVVEQKTGTSTENVMSQKATTDTINNFVLPYGECSTAGSTAAKVVTTSDGTFTLKRGARVMVKFINTHTASSMTLNVNGTGAKGVYWNGSNLTSSMIIASNIYDFVYDGTYWRIVGVDTDTTYSNATQSTAGLMSTDDKVKIDSIGDINFLQTENKTSIVLAINEINAKTIKNNNSIPPFSGFMTYEDRSNIKNENYDVGSFSSDFHGSFDAYNPLSVYYNEVDNHFYYKDEGFFYYNWDFSYLYNTDDELSIGRDDVFFSYNNQHYIMWGGMLKDISIIQSIIAAIKDSTIQPFYGYLPSGSTVIEQSSSSTNGEVLYDTNNNRFVWKDLSGTFVQYYANWASSYLYNTTTDSSATAITGAIFSYNGKHYTIYNGTLQDMSALDDIASSTVNGIVKLSDSTTDSNYGADKGVAATPKAVASVGTAARNYTDSKASQTLESANQYTNEQITAKIQLVTELPENPIAGVLYCIPE